MSSSPVAPRRRVAEIAALWLIVFAAAYGLLRVIDEAFTVPGAYAGIDLFLAFFVSLPIAILTATGIAIARAGTAQSDRKRWLTGRRALTLALAALVAEALLVIALEARPGVVLQAGVCAAAIAVMLGAGGRIADLFAGLR